MVWETEADVLEAAGGVVTTLSPAVETSKPKTASVSVILPVMIKSQPISAWSVKPWMTHMTDACIKTMRDTTVLPFELIVVETESERYIPDRFRQPRLVGAYEPDIYIHQEFRTTYVKDFNAGLDAATGDYVVQTGNDVFTQPGWLEALLECFETYPDCGAASLGTHEGGGLSHRPMPFIIEGWYDPLMMWKKKDRPVDLWRFDEAYAGCFSSSDLIMRLYTAGYRCYRNHRVVCSHIGQQTWSDEEMNVVRPAATKLFIERWGNSPLWAASMILGGSVHFGREFMRGQAPG